MTENLGLKAADLYASGSSFGAISKELAVSKSSVGGLLRDGIESLRNNSVHTESEQALAVQEEGERKNTPENTYLPAQRHNPRPNTYQLEATVSQKTVALTPKALQIYDLFRYWGFSGDLSDFAEDGINHAKPLIIW